MEALRIEQIAALSGGRLIRGDRKALALRVCTDTRETTAGDCFVALKGDKSDGHHFLGAAAKSGAAVAIVSDVPSRVLPPRIAVIEVKDTLSALQKLAGNYRAERKLKVVAVTGSNGKTTTKEMIAAVLAVKHHVAKTNGNFNNHIGVPLSLLAINNSHEFGVFEAGTNHPGEIGALASLLKPYVSVITNIGWAHIENFGTKSAIAEEKGALVAALGRNGLAVLNADDAMTRSIAKRCKGRVLTTGISNAADVRATRVRAGEGLRFRLEVRDGGASLDLELPLMGRHQIYNALQAAAVGWAFGLTLEEIARGLRQVEMPKWRMQSTQVGSVKIYNDAYNANPDSMRAALEAFKHVKARGRKILVIGEMLELGDTAKAAHEEVGMTIAAMSHAKLLVTVGHLARLIGTSAQKHGLERALIADFETAEEAAQFLRISLRDGDCILLKGSRRVGLECIVETLKLQAAQMEDRPAAAVDFAEVGSGKSESGK